MEDLSSLRQQLQEDIASEGILLVGKLPKIPVSEVRPQLAEDMGSNALAKAAAVEDILVD